MNLFDKFMRLKSEQFKKADEQSDAPLSEQYPVNLEPNEKRFTRKLLIIGGITFVLAAAAIGIFFEPVKKIFSPGSPIQPAASASPSDQFSPELTNQNTAPDIQQKDSPQKISAVVNGWAKAWAAKDTASYLSFYAPEFAPPHGLTRSAWEKQRHNRLSKHGKIEIALSGLTVSLEKDTATAEFIQSYTADGFTENGLHKRLDLKLHGTRWLIVKETSQ